ncbi:hypothetical protein ACQKNX_07610 [Lysinibacillus sp. NPDC093712]|uniref:hypothetical protein n=1 Tax=Lysinibacillus sp. NPDC093712 TaxID=3390579 RepID=UPI003CFCFFAB
MHKFYEDLKEYILKQGKELKKTLIPYYETLFQLENYTEMKEFLTTYQNSNFTLDYNEPDERDPYSNGWIEVYEMNNPISYNIELDIGCMQGSYCKCEPSDLGFNLLRECCGIDCDVHLPKVSIVKEVKVMNHEFQGYERDLWTLEDKWNTESEKELQLKRKLDNVRNLENQIENLHKALEEAKSQLD